MKTNNGQYHKILWNLNQICGGGGGLVTKSCPTLVTPWTVACRLLCPWDSPGKNTGVGCHFLLQSKHSRQPRKRWKKPYKYTANQYLIRKKQKTRKRSITCKGTESVIKSLPRKKAQSQMASLVNFTKHLENN